MSANAAIIIFLVSFAWGLILGWCAGRVLR